MTNEDATTVEDLVIDETFRNLVDPADVHRMGRPDLGTGRPGDVLVEEVRSFASKGGFAGPAKAVDDGVVVTRSSTSNVALDQIAAPVAESERKPVRSDEET